MNHEERSIEAGKFNLPYVVISGDAEVPLHRADGVVIRLRDASLPDLYWGPSIHVIAFDHILAACPLYKNLVFKDNSVGGKLDAEVALKVPGGLKPDAMFVYRDGELVFEAYDVKSLSERTGDNWLECGFRALLNSQAAKEDLPILM